MKTEILPAETPGSIQRAVEILQANGLVAFPTDTVYGVGALAFREEAVKRIYLAKDRPDEKAIPILLGDPEDLERISLEANTMALKLAARFWPGPLTLIVLKHPELPDTISATPSVGVRIPDHPIARMLLRASGPMAVTSANLSGQPSPVTAKEVLDQLDGRIELILDGGKTPGGVASTVVNCLGVEPVILRQGPITMEQILEILS